MNAAKIAELLPFQPYWLPNLSLWLDASWGVFSGAAGSYTPAAFGDTVSLWVDRAAGIQFVQATLANRPTLQVVNGRPVVRSSGTQFMTCSPINFAGDCTFVANAVQTATTRMNVVGGVAAGQSFFGTSGTNQFLWRDSADAGLTLSYTVPSALQTYTGVRSGSTGTVYAGSSPVVVGSGTLAGTLTIAELFGRGAETSTGDIASVIAYSRALSFAEVARVAKFSR